MKLYFFGWPSYVGGADTRLVHTLKLWSKIINVIIVPNYNSQLSQAEWTRYLDRFGVQYCSFDSLPARLEGIGMAMCNDYFFSNKIAHKAKDKGLRIIWSSEMMWHHVDEISSIKAGIVDTVLYTSEFQKSKLKPEYDKCGVKLNEFIVDNYIDPADFPYVDRSFKKYGLAIGRISRPDANKYPENFPLFYEYLNLKEPQFYAMAWDKALDQKYQWHHFNSNWHLYRANEISVNSLLSMLDLYVYPLGHNFQESWGRSTAEAMLTGCVVVVPYGHHFVKFINNGVTGFMYKTYEQCRDICQMLQNQPLYRKQVGIDARQDLCQNTFNTKKHINKWKEIFNV